MVAYISEQDGNFNKQIDFSDERHLSERATVRILTSLDNILPEGQKLFSESLHCVSIAASINTVLFVRM